MQKLREQVTIQTNEGKSGYGNSGLAAAISGRGMRIKLLSALGIAVLCAGGAIYLSNAWIDSRFNQVQTAAPVKVEPEKPKVKIIVASKPLSYGVALTPAVIKEIEWPADALPTGAFRKSEDLITAEGARVVLTKIALNEPILESKITGPGQSASLSTLLEDGYKAVTIRVDDVLGVAGLITPGDRVDVLWTRVQGATAEPDQTYNELLLRGVKVLALDQTVAEENGPGKAPVGYAKAVTIEVSTLQAQKVALASSTGKMFLALQHVADDNSDRTRRITMSDLSVRLKQTRRAAPPVNVEAETQTIAADIFGVSKRPAASTQVKAKVIGKSRLVISEDYAIVGVTRGLERREYNVLQAVEPY